jgi:hypothetical protein
VKKLLIGLLALGSISSFAEINCKSIVGEQLTYECPIAYSSPSGLGFPIFTRGCLMSFEEDNEGNRYSISADYSEKEGIIVTYKKNSSLIDAGTIPYTEDSKEINGSVELSNGVTILCEGSKE